MVLQGDYVNATNVTIPNMAYGTTIAYTLRVINGVGSAVTITGTYSTHTPPPMLYPDEIMYCYVIPGYPIGAIRVYPGNTEIISYAVTINRIDPVDEKTIVASTTYISLGNEFTLQNAIMPDAYAFLMASDYVQFSISARTQWLEQSPYLDLPIIFVAASLPAVANYQINLRSMDSLFFV